MTTADPKSLVLRFVDEFWSKGNLGAADELMTPDVVIHQPAVGDIADLKACNTTLRAAFPDWSSTPEELIAEGDGVAERWTGRGTHRGNFKGSRPLGTRWRYQVWCFLASGTARS
jgi:predicted ester cyclase